MNKLNIYLMILGFVSMNAQQIVVSGVVSDEDKNPISGCFVMVKETSRSVVTDMNGAYKIAVPKGATLVFKELGFFSKEVLVQERSINVVLATDTKALDEVSINGHYTPTLKSFLLQDCLLKQSICRPIRVL